MATLQSYAARWAAKPPTLKSAVVNGANANTSITVTGIKFADVIASVIEYASGVPTTDRTAATSVYAADTIRCTASTAGNKLVVLYWSV